MVVVTVGAAAFVLLILFFLFLLVVELVVVVIVVVEVRHVRLGRGGRLIHHLLPVLDAVLVDGCRHRHIVAVRLQTRRRHLFSYDILILLVLALGVLPAAVHHRRIHVGRRKCVGLVEQRDHAQQDCPDVLGGVPTLAGKLPALRVVDGRVQNGDTQVSVLVHVGVPHLGEEAHGGRRVGVVWGKFHVGLEVSAFV
uniref:Uncharacterized protein n=1 Tax=Ixodes ricinus TaxID=34613 RepID=A0A6B0V1L3_IXORI